jgi:group I intron endonuclease
MIIYKLTCPENKSYIGATTRTLTLRMSEHKCHSLHKNRSGLIGKAIEKYGLSNFKSQVLDTASTKEELIEKEKYWIAKLNTIETGYNVSAGGLGPTGNWVSDKLKKIRSKRSKENWKDPKIRSKRLTGILASLTQDEQKRRSKISHEKRWERLPFVMAYEKTTGKFIGKWKDRRDAAKALNMHQTTLHRALTGTENRKYIINLEVCHLC